MANTYWTADGLKAFAAKTKDVEIEGSFIQVRKLPASAMDGSSDKESANYIIIQKGLATPELSIEEIKNLPVDVLKKIVDSIVEFSGLDLEKAEKN